MRAREFLMKDAYSFHSNQACLQTTYDTMHQAYCNVFERIGLGYRPVMADSGSIGGALSHEFHVLADSGEDAIAFSTESQYAANIEKAETLAPAGDRPSAGAALLEVATPGQHTIEAVSEFLKIPTSQTIKTLIVLGETKDDSAAPMVALVLRGDHQLNDIKAEKLAGVASPLTFAPEERINSELGLKLGSIGPIGLDIDIIVDFAAAHIADFACGANKDDQHYTGANWERDLALPRTADIRNVVAGDPSPDGKGSLEIKRGIEVGHIFQLGTKYSEAMNATVLDENGKAQAMLMGCYGIGVSRIVASAIEQNHDSKGIIWPENIAPFQIALVPINMHKSEAVAEKCEALYEALQAAGIDVLFMDEAKARLGVMLANTELMGIPHRIVIGDKGLEKGCIEYKGRRDTENRDIPSEELMDFLSATLKH